MNTIYLKTAKSQRKIKTYPTGNKEKAMIKGFDLAFKNPTNEYFIITDDEKCLKFNKNIVL